MTIKELEMKLMKELKIARQATYDEAKKQSDYTDANAEKAAADTAYLAMMLDVDLDEGDTENE